MFKKILLIYHSIINYFNLIWYILQFSFMVENDLKIV
ncbi:uncharacterized protein METZ01_LOCUS422604, partial [marine metagenome]